MNKSATSKEELLETAKLIAYREGIGALNIRRVASESGVAIGTVYNYYPSKGDLIGALMEDFWRNVFHGSHFDTESRDFIGSFREIYGRLEENLKKFRREFLDGMASVGQSDQQKGKTLEEFYLEHMRAGMLSILERDERVDPEIWNEDLTKERFVAFAFSNMELLLKGKMELACLEEIMSRLIYGGRQKGYEEKGEQKCRQ